MDSCMHIELTFLPQSPYPKLPLAVSFSPHSLQTNKKGLKLICRYVPLRVHAPPAWDLQ